MRTTLGADKVRALAPLPLQLDALACRIGLRLSEGPLDVDLEGEIFLLAVPRLHHMKNQSRVVTALSCAMDVLFEV